MSTPENEAYVPTQEGVEYLGTDVYTEADLEKQEATKTADRDLTGTSDLGDEIYTKADLAKQAAARKALKAEAGEKAKTVSKADLVKQAEALGLDSSGTKTQIEERILAHQDTGAGGTTLVSATNASTPEGAGA